MHPVIVRFGPFFIYSYGLLLAVAFFTSMFLTQRHARREGIGGEIITNLSFLAIVFGIVGARLLYVVLNLKYFLRFPLEIFMLHHGGLALYGGLILGTCAGAVFLKKNNLSVLKTADLVIPYVALGQAIGRIGCLLNGCCFGQPTSIWGLYFPMHNAILIPTQTYSSLALLLIYFALRLFQTKSHRAGEIFMLFFLLYSIKRFLIEFLRNDSAKFFFSLTIFQIISVFIFVLSLFILISIRRKKI